MNTVALNRRANARTTFCVAGSKGQNCRTLETNHFYTRSIYSLSLHSRDTSLLPREGYPMPSRTPVRHNLRKILFLSAASLVLCSSLGRADDADRGNHGDDTRTPIKH